MPQHITFSCMHECIVTAYRLQRLPHFRKSWLPDVLVELSSAENITSTRVKILSKLPSLWEILQGHRYPQQYTYVILPWY